MILDPLRDELASLEAEGLKFDGSGQFMGTTEQAVESVVKVIEKKFGNLSETLATESLKAPGAMPAML